MVIDKRKYFSLEKDDEGLFITTSSDEKIVVGDKVELTGIKEYDGSDWKTIRGEVISLKENGIIELKKNERTKSFYQLVYVKRIFKI